MKTKLIFISLAFLSFFCSESQESERTELDKELANIMAYIETDVCTDGSICRFAAIGSKPCGGPKSYAFFPASIDTTLLLSMINNYNEREDAYNRKWGIISDCSFVGPPDSVFCSDGECAGYFD